MRNILNISKTPISTYPHTAHMAAFLWNDSRIYPWLMNCFIKLFSWDLENMDYEDFWFLDCPVLLCERLSRSMIQRRWGNYLSFIEDGIDMGYYVYLIVKTGEIRAYGGYKYPHDLLIYGYDNEKRVFFISDFFQGRHYGKQAASYEEMEKALIYDDKTYTCHWVFHDDMILIKPNHYDKFEFQPERVATSISDYLAARPTVCTYSRVKLNTEKEIDNHVFGMDCYKILKSHIRKNMDGYGPSEHWRQVFHLMYEHKAVMKERVKYMRDIGVLRNGECNLQHCVDMESDAHLIRNMYIKYVIRGNKSMLQKLDLMIKGLEEKEYKYLSEICKDIRRIHGNQNTAV